MWARRARCGRSRERRATEAADASTAPRATRRAWARARFPSATATPSRGAPMDTSSTRASRTIHAQVTSSPMAPGSAPRPAGRAWATSSASGTRSDPGFAWGHSGRLFLWAARFFCLLAGLRLKVRDEIEPVLRGCDRDIHLLPGDELLRIGEPALERLGRPHHAGSGDRGRIGVTGGAAGLAAEHPAMRRPAARLVERVAAAAFRLVESGTARGIRG